MKNIPIITLLLLASSLANATGISIKVADKIKTGSIVPVSITANRPVEPGDTLVLMADGKQALTLRTDENPITFVSTRLRLINGDVSAQVRRADGSTDRASQHANIKIPADPPPETASGSISHKERVKKGYIKVLFSNRMPADNYIDRVNLETNRGSIQIEMTPMISANPYFHIKGEKHISEADVRASLNYGEAYRFTAPRKTYASTGGSNTSPDAPDHRTSAPGVPMSDYQCAKPVMKGNKGLNKDENKALLYLLNKRYVTRKKSKEPVCIKNVNITDIIKIKGNKIIQYDATVAFPYGYRMHCIESEKKAKRLERQGGYSWDHFLSVTSGDCSGFSAAARDPLGYTATPGETKKVSGEVEI